MFALLEAESAFKKRQKRKDLDDRWNYWKKVIIQANKTVPGPARDAFKNIIRRRDKIYFAATDSSDPALGGSSGFDPGTKSTGTFTGNADDVEQDAIATDLENLPKQSGMGMQSQIDPSNRVSKDQKDRDGHLERIKNIVYVLDKNNLKKAISKGRAEVEDFLLTDRLPTKEIRKYTTKYYALVAEKFGLQGLLFKGNIYFADGSSTKADPNDETHKEIAQAQYELGALDNRDADQYVDMYGLKDLPSQSGMAQQMQAGSKGFKRDEVEWNGKPVPALNKYNWKQWIELGNGLLTRYVAFKDKSGNESVAYKNTLTIAESIRSYLNTLTEKTEMSDQDKANWKLLQQQFAKVKKELPPEALKAYRDLELKKRDYDISGIDSGPFDDNRDFGKDRYDAKQKETYGDFYDIIQSVLKNTNLQTIKAAEQKIEKMNKEVRNLPVLHSTMKAQMYGSIAKRLGWKGIFNLDGKTVTFAETTPRQPNFFGDLSDMDKRLFMNGEHVTKDVTAVEKDADMKKIAYKQFRLGFLPNAVIPKFINKLNSADPNSEEKTATGGALPKVTLKGKMHLNKELPPLSSKTVEDYKKVYRKILRRYTAGTGKGRSYSKVPESTPANSIRQILNILSEAGAKMSSADIEDLTAIEQAFKDAEKRKLITPQEVADFAPLISSKEQLTNQLKYDPKKQGNTPDTLKKAMAIKAPGSDTNYGVFNDQVMAVINNPSPENLIKQAEAAAAMDLDGFDTDRMKFSAFYGHVAKAMGLTGLITHRNSFMNSPMVVSSKARKTDFSNKMPDMLPFGEYSVEAVDFDNPQHKAVAQAQLNKNLLPASIQMSSTNTVDDVYKRFGITKQEPQEPEKRGDVSPTVKSGEEGKPSEPTDLDAADALQAAGQATTDTGQTTPTSGRSDRPSADGRQAASKVGSVFGKKFGQQRRTDKLHYERFIPLPTEINNLLKLPQSRTYYVDRIRDSESNAGANISDTLNIVSEKTANGGSYKIARQISKDMSQAAYKAIIDMLKSRNLQFIDQAQADKFAQFKATNAELDANKGDPGETRDLWTGSSFGDAALAKKKAERERKFNHDVASHNQGGGQGGNRLGSAVGTGKTPGEAVYYDIINSGGQMRQKVWAEFDANGTEVRRGQEGQEYKGDLPQKQEYRNRQEAGTASHLQGGGQGGNNLGAGQGTRPAYYTGPLQGGRFKIHSADGKVIKTVGERPTGLPTLSQYNATDRVVPADSDTERERVNKIDQFHSELGQQKQTSTVNDKVGKIPVQNQDANKVNDAPDSSVQSAANKRPEGPLKDVINKAKDELSSSGKEDYEQYQKNLRKKDNSSTDFTRLLKNAGLLKEFY
jgi:hypothetical protein